MDPGTFILTLGDKGAMVLGNVTNHSPNKTLSHHIRNESSATPL